jgi:cell wall assembly regulator SMI1
MTGESLHRVLSLGEGEPSCRDQCKHAGRTRTNIMRPENMKYDQKMENKQITWKTVARNQMTDEGKHASKLSRHAGATETT